MSRATTAGATADEADRGLDRVADRLLVWLPALTACGAVAAYLTIHAELITKPGGRVLSALTAGGLAPDLGLHGSFFLLLMLPTALLLALALAIWPWTRLYDRRPTLRLLATATVTSALIVLLQIALGAAGMLATGPLAVTAVGLAGVFFVIDRARRTVARTQSPPALPTASSRCSPAMLATGPFAGLAARLGLAAPTRLGLALGVLTAASWVALAGLAALAPPWGWDTLVYHLTDVFWFAQTGALEPFPHPAHQFHFPKVPELHALWYYLLAGGGEDAWRVTGIALLPLALTCGIAVRAAGELLGLESALPWLAPATMLLPLALIQPLAGYTDLALTAFLLAGFAFLLAALRRGRAADWALAALACGLALGSKLSFLYLGLPLLLLLAKRPERVRLRPVILLWLPLCALFFAVGCGYWLLPKALRTGNPFHPVAVTVAGRTLLEGPAVIDIEDSNRQRYTGSPAGWLTYPLAERSFGRLAYSPDNGFGPQFAAAWLSLPFALVLALRRRRGLLSRALLAAPVTALAWIVFSPWEHPRYALTACGFALLGLAAVEEAATGGPGASPVARRLLRSAVVVALLFAAPAGVLAAAPEPGRIAARWAAGDWRPEEIYPQLYGPAGSVFNWIAEHGGEGTTVSFDSPVFVAPLFGWHGQNRVVYATSPGERGGEGLPTAGSSRAWRRFLDREQVDLVVVWNRWWEAAAEPTLRQRWIAARPEAFVELASFGAAARIFSPHALPADATEPAVRPVTELSSERWVLEYATGATVDLASDPAGGLRIDYQFLTHQPDYLDLRLDLTEGDWPPDARLVFGLDSPAGSPLLWIYLKEVDARRSCRYRVPPRPAASTSHRVAIDLARPHSATPGFALRRAASVHLVLDDAGSTRATSGSLRLHGFRLETATNTPPSASSQLKEGPS